MDFQTAIKEGWKNWLNFSSRARRSEYWYWHLFAFLLLIAATILDHAILHSAGPGPIYAIAALAVFLPGLAVAVRRLHDLDKSGWWLLLYLIPIVGVIIILVWVCTKGTPGANRFGPERT
jgi:uncharacterized membrane protein YhaH (DUF805 family)